MGMQFNNPSMSVWLWVSLGLVAIIIFGITHRKSLLSRFVSPKLVLRLTASSSNERRNIKGILIATVLLLTTLSLIDPRWGTKYKEVEQTGIDTFFVLDVSRSMLAEDVRPSRLSSAVTAIKDVLDVMGSDRAGLITVSGDAALTVPLTLDYSSMKLSLDDVSPRSVNRGGTMIGDGIRLAIDSFTDDVPEHKAIIVLTDGEDMGSYPIDAAADAAAKGIAVYTVGIGDVETGARIPTTLYGRPSYVQFEGKDVWTKMNPSELKDVATAGNGVFIPAGTANLDLASIYSKRIATDAGKSFDSVKLEQYIPRFQWFAIPGVSCLLCWLLLSTQAKNIRHSHSYQKFDQT